MKELKEPPAYPVLHWVFKTATGGKEGIITNHQRAYDARAAGMKELEAEQGELTIIQLNTNSVPVMLAMPLPLEGFVLKFPELEVKPPVSIVREVTPEEDEDEEEDEETR